MAFWDASALALLCINPQANPEADRLFQEYEMVVWWAAGVEIRSAIARLERMGQITNQDTSDALVQLDDLKRRWQEIDPSPSLRDLAEELPQRYGLRAADALQLAAASAWTMQHPANRPFLSGDQKLLEAARQMGFRAIAV
ncbi:MAG: hypothetical protein WA634_10375 [Silvibacterium sp.]